MPTRTLRCFAVISFFILCSVFGYSQAPGQVLGTPSLQKYINVGGGVDEINTGDLTVHVSIPLMSKGVYGPIASASLEMDSRTYMYNYNAGSGNQIFSSFGFQFVSAARAHTQFSFSANGNHGNCIPPLPSLAGYGAYEGNGTFHPATSAINGCGLGPLITGADGWSLGVGLGYTTYGWDFGSEEISPSGITTKANFLNNGAPCPAYSAFDLHANTISDNLCWSYNSSGVVNQASGTLTDAASNEVLRASLSANNTVLLQYPGPNSTTATYTITYYTYLVNQDFGCPGLTVPAVQNIPLPLNIQYPDGSAAWFTYEENPLHPGSITGRIAEIHVPAGDL